MPRSGHSPSAPMVGLIATGGEDKALRLWEAETGRVVRTISGYVDGVWSVAFSPDGTRIASVSGTYRQLDQVRVHEVETGRALTVPIKAGTGLVSSVAFSVDGGSLVIASGMSESQGWVTVRDAQTGREQFTILVGPEPVHSAALSPDGTSIMAVVGPNNTADFTGKKNESGSGIPRPERSCSRLVATRSRS